MDYSHVTEHGRYVVGMQTIYVENKKRTTTPNTRMVVPRCCDNRMLV